MTPSFSFMYSMKDNLVALGLMVGLDYTDPNTDPQVLLQRMKTHPVFQKYLKGGKVIQYGAKTVPLGGWFAMPRLYADGLLLSNLLGNGAAFTPRWGLVTADEIDRARAAYGDRVRTADHTPLLLKRLAKLTWLGAAGERIDGWLQAIDAEVSPSSRMSII